MRTYVRGGFRTGLVLNPLACERTISRQLSDSARVPALYAYLVNDRTRLEASPAWDAPAWAREHPESLKERSGPLGHAWRHALRTGQVTLGRGTSRCPHEWSGVHRAARQAARGILTSLSDDTGGSRPVHYVIESTADDVDLDEALQVAAAVGARDDLTVHIRLSSPRRCDVILATLVTLSLPSAALVVDATITDPPDAEVVVVRGPAAQLDADAVGKLIDAGRHGLVAPLWRDTDGTLAALTVGVHAGRRIHLLAAHPVEDARRLGPSVAVPEIAGRTRAWPGGGARTGQGTVLTDIEVMAPSEPPPPQGVARERDADALLARAGWAVPDQSAPPGAPLALARTGDPGTLRWAIKTAAPAGSAGLSWGDTHFAQALAGALRRLGQEVVVDAYEARDRATTRLDDVTLVLRGPHRIDPPRRPRSPASAVSLLWIISHPDEITPAEVSGFDRAFAASLSWARTAGDAWGLRIDPLLQCTDPTRFHPTGATRTDDLVFVGTARGIARPSVVEPLRAGIPVRVYGPDWRGFIPASAIAATEVANDRLPLLYESASAVLNDHWPAMRAAGFISNRPYDVVAAGGRVISDDVAGIEEEFGGAIAVYRTTAELLDILRGDIDDAFGTDAEIEAISARIRRTASFDARARVLVEAAENARRETRR